MNNDRRKEIQAVSDGLDSIKNEIDSLAADEQTGEAGGEDELAANVGKWSSKLDDLKGDLENARDDEQSYYDSMPEGLQGGERGSNAEEAVRAMEEVISDMEEIVGMGDEPAEFMSMFHDKYDNMSSRLSDAQA